MDRINELLSRITELLDNELEELRQSILAEFDSLNRDPGRVFGVDAARNWSPSPRPRPR